jgi:hypothetical protein
VGAMALKNQNILYKHWLGKASVTKESPAHSVCRLRNKNAKFSTISSLHSNKNPPEMQ